MEANTSLCHRSNVRILAPAKSSPFFVSTWWKMEIMKIVLGGFWNNAVLALLMIYTLIILSATFDSGFKSD